MSPGLFSLSSDSLHGPGVDPSTLLRLADLSLIEFNRESARATRGGVVHEEGGLVFFVPGHRFPVGFTGVMRADSRVSADAVIARHPLGLV